jgi:hypothetical protein
VTVTLRACEAGRRPKGGHSIAQLIANQLKVPVYAWKPGMFFSLNMTATGASPEQTGITTSTIIPPGTPVYLLPWGGTAVLPCKFMPGQDEPVQCASKK